MASAVMHRETLLNVVDRVRQDEGAASAREQDKMIDTMRKTANDATSGSLVMYEGASHDPCGRP